MTAAQRVNHGSVTAQSVNDERVIAHCELRIYDCRGLHRVCDGTERNNRPIRVAIF
jgi:hypothetical protein